jgi:hypothetical protein
MDAKFLEQREGQAKIKNMQNSQKTDGQQTQK